MSIELPSTYKHTNISDGVRSACLKNPSKIAYKHGKNTRTYSELAQRIDSISSLISSFGILSKSNIAIVASNSIEYMEIVLAASQLGHPIATVNPKLTIKEILKLSNHNFEDTTNKPTHRFFVQYQLLQLPLLCMFDL